MLQYVPKTEQVACFSLVKDGVNSKSAYQVVGTEWDIREPGGSCGIFISYITIKCTPCDNRSGISDFCNLKLDHNQIATT